MFDFISGMVTMGFLVAALFFFKFWSGTRDFLFLTLGVAFVCFAITHALPILLDIPREERSWIYIVRLLGFTTLIVGIIAKNAKGRRRGAPGGQSPP
jgi:hypothetical protein